jgi:hypothetical protein
MRGARIRERHDRINSEGKGPLPPTIATGHTPVSRAIRVDEKMQSAPVAPFALRTEVSVSGILVSRSRFRRYAHIYPNKIAG